MPELPPKAFSKSRTIGTGSPGPLGKVRERVPDGGVIAGLQSGPGYAELQVTSNFSFLRGASHPDELVLTAAALGHRAIAITDRNSVAGIVRAHQAAETVGIRLVVGVRLDLRDGTSFLAYPEDRAAYGRLTRLLTLGRRRAPKGECHLDYADVVAHGEGQILIVLPLDGINATAVAKRVAADFAGRAYLAAHYLYRSDDARRLTSLASLANNTGLPLVAVNDVLYHVPERRSLQDVVTCIREHCMIAEAGFRLLAHAERHLKPPIEMARLFRGYEDALARSLEIVDRLHFGLEELRYEYPEEPVPHGKTAQQHLANLVWQGAAERLPGCFADEASFETHQLVLRSRRRRRLEEGAPQDEDAVEDGINNVPHPEEAANQPSQRTHDACFSSVTPAAAGVQGPAAETVVLDSRLCGNDDEKGTANQIPAHIRGTIEHELDLIEQLDFARYFLTVHDIVTFARSQGILCQGRGSAANSVVCYCLGITSVDPSRIDVLFERFISAARGEPPDIDVDFEHERREEVIQYIYDKYGRDRAGLVATVICYRARGAIREVGKVMGLSGDVVAALAGMVWGWSSEAIADKRVRETGLDPSDRTLRLAIDLAGELIGFPRHLSQHVGGFVITRGPLSELVPIENAAMADRTVIEWDKDDLDALGILKIDILALGMLSCIRRSFSLIAQHYRQSWALHTVPEGRPEVYDMLSRADSLGVFQVESRAQMTMLPRLKPREYYDLVIEVAIVRPGPIQGDMVHPYLRRRNGKEPVEYPSDALRRVLGKTLGVPLFQEQAMQIAIVGAGFTPGDADRLRRAMATFKRNGDIHKFREQFVAGMLANGYTADFATRCFDQIEGFGTYGFPESHAASFALLVYVSAWIKCFYPDVFACALLNSQPMGFYAPAQIVRDASQHGAEIRPIDVNFSDWDCTLEPPAAPSVAPGTNPGSPPPPLRRGGSMLVPPPLGGGGGPCEARWRGPTQMALRLGLRQVKGFSEADAKRLVEGRGDVPYRDAADLWRRSGLGRAAIERLAAADALRSLELDRRRGLWAVKALGEPPLPLFAATATEEPNKESSCPVLSRASTKTYRSDAPGAWMAGSSPAMTGKRNEKIAAALLPAMPLGEHVVEDYVTTGLTIKHHPLAFLRAELRRDGLVTARDLATLPVNKRLSIAGLVLIRQRPGSANGVVFITLEDETGIANLIVWPATLERFRRAALGATLLYCRGVLQREESVIHLVAEDLRDWSARLKTLRDRTGDEVPALRQHKSPFAQRERLPGYDSHDLIIHSRDFR
jgi:error-prone DNA polymerase